MRLITISGLDGSGKSTQIQLLKEYLESKSKKVFYFHAIQFGLAQKISEFKRKYCLICKLTGKCKTSAGEKGVTQANAFQIAFRKLFLQIDVRRFGKLHTQLRNSGYDYILSDRYFYDTLINIQYLAKKDVTVSEKNIAKPDLAFYMEVSPELIMQRDRKPEQGLEYLKVKNALFRSKIIEWNMKTIDASRPKELIFEDLKKLCQI